jgi:hypothetical protein
MTIDWNAASTKRGAVWVFTAIIDTQQEQINSLLGK